MTWDIPALANSVVQIVGKFVPDRDAQVKIQAELQLKMLEMQQTQLAAQSETNKTEAGHASVFVAGARPFVMWVCGFGLLWEFVAAPVVAWTAALCGYTGDLPQIGGDHLFELVIAMLGLAGWRSYDKTKGVDTKRIEIRKATRA